MGCVNTGSKKEGEGKGGEGKGPMTFCGGKGGGTAAIYH